MSSWENLADTYEDLQVKEDSLDALVEFPAQRALIGDLKGKRVLDIGCGSGRKALAFALAGAKSVLAIDKSERFISKWAARDKPENLQFALGDVSFLGEAPELFGQKFDVVTCLQAIYYSSNLSKTLADIRGLLELGGVLVVTTPHPFRFVREKMDRFNLSASEAYREESPYSFPALWDSSVTLTHATPTFSTFINSLIAAGFAIEQLVEPDLSEEQKEKFPHKKEWMDNYLGMVAYRCVAV